MDSEVVGKALSGLGRTVGPGLIAKAKEMGMKLPPELDAQDAQLPPGLVVPLLRDIAHHFFPLLGGGAQDTNEQSVT
jgi:hypothetical protein